jgi:tetratricopeptide (TPR) repeat protein
VDDARVEFERYRKLAPMGPREEYFRARLEFAQGNAALALQRLDGVVRRLDTASTQFWLGQALEAMEDLEGAEQRYRLAVLRSPWDPVPSLNVVRLAQRRGDWRAVIHYARRVVEDGPERFAGWAALVPALIQIGDLQEAEEVARAAVERFPDRREPHVWLANSLRSQRRPAEALELLDALEAERLERYEAKARKQWPKGQRHRLARELEPLGPEPSELVAERALAFGTGGRVEEGLELVQKALDENPDHARLHAVRAALLLAVGREREASRSTKRALNLDPSDLWPLKNRALFGVATGRLDLARRDCEDYLARLPDDAPVNFLLGLLREQGARPAEAIEAYRRAAKFDERNWASRNNLAVLLQKPGELDAALVAAEEAFALAGENASVQDTLGFVCLRKGLVDRAVPLLEKAHAAAPQVAEIQLHLAEAYRDAGRTQDARRLLGQLRARADTPPELRAGVEEVLASLP